MKPDSRLVAGIARHSLEAQEHVRALSGELAEAQQRIAALEAMQTELERQIDVLGSSVMDAHEEARRLGLDPNDDATPVQWLVAAGGRIAALEADDAVWCKHSLVQLVEERNRLREQVATANLRAERLRVVVDRLDRAPCSQVCMTKGQPSEWRCRRTACPVYDLLLPLHDALAAEPSPSPLRQVREALALAQWCLWPGDIDYYICPVCRASKDGGHAPDCIIAAALALLADLGVT